MNNHTNSAIRLSTIITSAFNDDNKKTIDVWKNIFQIDETDKHSTEMAVIECLNALNEELVVLIDNMNETTFPKELFINEINSLKTILIVPTGINSDWAPIKNKITLVDLKVLAFCSEILPKDSKIDEKEIEELKKLLAELETFLNQDTLPYDLIKILKTHLQKMKSALYKYDINGFEVFDEVLKSAYGEVRKNPSFFSEGNEISKKLFSIWSKTQKIYQFSTKAHNAFINFSNMADTVKSLVP